MLRPYNDCLMQTTATYKKMIAWLLSMGWRR